VPSGSKSRSAGSEVIDSFHRAGVAKFIGDEFERKEKRAVAPAAVDAVLEPAAGQIRKTGVGVAEMLAQQS
jgi:hypothetical protein